MDIYLLVAIAFVVIEIEEMVSKRQQLKQRLKDLKERAVKPPKRPFLGSDNRF